MLFYTTTMATTPSDNDRPSGLSGEADPTPSDSVEAPLLIDVRISRVDRSGEAFCGCFAKHRSSLRANRYNSHRANRYEAALRQSVWDACGMLDEYTDGSIVVANAEGRHVRVSVRGAPSMSEEYDELPPMSFAIYSYDGRTSPFDSIDAIRRATSRARDRLAICAWSRDRCWCEWCSLDADFNRDRSWFTPTHAGIGVDNLFRYIIDTLTINRTASSPAPLLAICWRVVAATYDTADLLPPALRAEFRARHAALARFEAAPKPIDPYAIMPGHCRHDDRLGPQGPQRSAMDAAREAAREWHECARLLNRDRHTSIKVKVTRDELHIDD
jgi:hypothetical protein